MPSTLAIFLNMATTTTKIWMNLPDPLFIEQSKKNISDKSRINNYAGLIIYKSGLGATEKEACMVTENFKQHYPNFLWLNDVSQWFTRDKDLMSCLFLSPEIQDFKPRWKAYKKTYTPDLAQQIINDIGSSMYVIKPINATRGRGITVVLPEELDKHYSLFLIQN